MAAAIRASTAGSTRSTTSTPTRRRARDRGSPLRVRDRWDREQRRSAARPEDVGKSKVGSALRLLAHFVGDVHQPLHVSHPDMRGGTTIDVCLRRRGTTLHRLWDGGPRSQAAPARSRSRPALARVLRSRWRIDARRTRARAGRRRSIRASGPRSRWRSRSSRSSRGAGTRRSGDAYYEEAMPIVEERLAQAGHPPRRAVELDLRPGRAGAVACRPPKTRGRNGRVEIHGSCDARFAARARRLRRTARESRRVGASVAVTVDGRSVVDLWGGHADPRTHAAVARDTIVNVFSTTKGDGGALRASARRRGQARPRRAGRALLAGVRAGGQGRDPGALAARRTRRDCRGATSRCRAEALYDWDAMCAALAAQAPWWEPGTAHGYHAMTFGWLVGEVVRRITGKSVGRYFRDEIAGPARRRHLHRHAGRARCALRRADPGAARSSTAATATPTSREAAREREAVRAQGVHEPAAAAGRVQLARLARRRDSRPRTATAARAAWRASTARSRAAAASTACTCSRATRSTARASSSVTASTTCSRSCRPSSASASRSAPRPSRSARIRAPSVTPGAGGSFGFADPEARRRLRLRDEPDGDGDLPDRPARDGADERGVRESLRGRFGWGR